MQNPDPRHGHGFFAGWVQVQARVEQTRRVRQVSTGPGRMCGDASLRPRFTTRTNATTSIDVHAIDAWYPEVLGSDLRPAVVRNGDGDNNDEDDVAVVRNSDGDNNDEDDVAVVFIAAAVAVVIIAVAVVIIADVVVVVVASSSGQVLSESGQRSVMA